MTKEENKKRVKKYDEHNASVEIDKAEKLIPLAVEMKTILAELEADSIAHFELKVNEKTNFINSMMSATALGLDYQYKRLLELEQKIDSRLSLNDITAQNKLKSTFIDKLKEKHTTYYSDDEFEAVKQIEAIKERYNSAYNDYLKLPQTIQKMYVLNGGLMVKNQWYKLMI